MVKQNTFLVRQNKTGCKFSRESSFSSLKHEHTHTHTHTHKSLFAACWGFPAFYLAGRTQPAADKLLVCFYNVWGLKTWIPLKMCILSRFAELESILLNLSVCF